MLRRFVSLLMVLLTVNVSAAEALRVCANREKHDMHEQAKHEGCEKPAPKPAPTTACCDAMASCTTTLAIDGASGESGVIPDRRQTTPATATAPSALERSPEPPPPKGQA